MQRFYIFQKGAFSLGISDLDLASSDAVHILESDGPFLKNPNSSVNRLVIVPWMKLLMDEGWDVLSLS